jgi:NADH-quinone oxidoreductase subunit M
MEHQLNAATQTIGQAFLLWIGNPVTQLLLWPLLGCLAVSLIPAQDKLALRITALASALMSFLCSVLMVTGAGPLANQGLQLGGSRWFPFEQYLRFSPDPSAGVQFIQHFRWMAIRFGETQSFGVDYFVGVDGLSLPLVLLCTSVLVLVVLWAWKREERLKEFLALTLFMQTGILGSFVALDYVLLYLFWEWMLIPMFFLIAGWGKRREEAARAAIKFFIYTLFGSVFMLIGFIALQVFGEGAGVYTFDIVHLAVFGMSDAVNSIPISFRLLMFLGLLIGFAVKTPMWPLHTWLPDAHSEAPTEMSVILAALMLKCGTYAYLRILYPTFPDICYHAGPFIAFCGVVAIVYGAGVTLMQTDLKRMVAYSSISHMGFIVLGISAMNPNSTTGAIFLMVGHGLVISLLFFLVGWIEERFGTRDMRELSGLWFKAPQAGGLLTLAAFAGMGFPGLVAFWGELFIIQGTYFNNPQWLGVVVPGPLALLRLWGNVLSSFQHFTDNDLWFGPAVPTGMSGAQFLQICAWAAAFGVLVSAVYMITMLVKVVFSGRDRPAAAPAAVLQPAYAGGPEPVAVLPAAASGPVDAADTGEPTAPPAISGAQAGPGLTLDWNQTLVLYPLAAAIVFFGLDPQPLLSLFQNIGSLMATAQWRF